MVSIDTGEVLAGSIPPKMLRRIRRILAEHPDEALAAFQAALSHNAVTRLEPTRVQTKGEPDA